MGYSPLDNESLKARLDIISESYFREIEDVKDRVKCLEEMLFSINNKVDCMFVEYVHKKMSTIWR